MILKTVCLNTCSELYDSPSASMFHFLILMQLSSASCLKRDKNAKVGEELVGGDLVELSVRSELCSGTRFLCSKQK